MKAKILVSIFAVMITAPAILFFILLPTSGTVSAAEKRDLAAFPQFSWETLDTYPSGIENYYNDRLPFRDRMVQANTFANYKLFGVLNSDTVAAGKDGWLFYKNKDDGSPLDAYANGSSFAPEALARIGDRLQRMQDAAYAQGADFLFVMAPNKEEVYSEYVPDAYKKVSGDRAFNQLYDYLKQNTGVRVVRADEALLPYKDDYTLYYKTDTHWNDLSGFLAAQQVLEAFGMPASTPDDVEITQKPAGMADLSDMAGLQMLDLESVDYEISGYMPGVAEPSHLEQRYAPELRITSTIGNGEKLVAARDSFMSAVIPWLSPAFSEAYYYLPAPGYAADNNFAAYEELLIREKPTKVIVESVERYLPLLAAE